MQHIRMQHINMQHIKIQHIKIQHINMQHITCNTSKCNTSQCNASECNTSRTQHINMEHINMQRIKMHHARAAPWTTHPLPPHLVTHTSTHSDFFLRAACVLDSTDWQLACLWAKPRPLHHANELQLVADVSTRGPGEKQISIALHLRITSPKHIQQASLSPLDKLFADGRSS